MGPTEEKNEMDELKQLLPDIREKVEDAKESQRTASAASQAIQQTLIPVTSSDSASSSKVVSDISHLVRKKPANHRQRGVGSTVPKVTYVIDIQPPAAECVAVYHRCSCFPWRLWRNLEERKEKRKRNAHYLKSVPLLRSFLEKMSTGALEEAD
ncbi:unnamed protein product [Lampetra planeri]